MSVHTAGEIEVDVDRRTAFAFLQDPARLGGCIPGCSDLRETAPRRYSAVLTSRIAFMTINFNVTIDILTLDPPRAIEARIVGDALGLAGHVAATATVRLAEAGEHRTRISYTTDIALTGKLGGLGQPVFQAASAQMARQFGANLKKAIEATATEAPA